MDRPRIIAEYGKLIHAEKLVIGAGGNISEKRGDFLIIKKKFADMSRGRKSDYIRLSFKKAESPERSGYLSSETPLHLACYRARQDVGAVVHVHSPYIIATAQKTNILESVSYEFDCVLQKSVPTVEYIQPGSAELAEKVAERIKEGANAVMLKKHGAVSVGKDIKEAYLRILALERACITSLHS